MRAIALLFAVLMVGSASGEAKVACKLPMYIQAPHAPGDGDYGYSELVSLRPQISGEATSGMRR